MASDNGSKKTWKCKYKCPVTPEPCPHLEKLLSKKSKKTFGMVGDSGYFGNKIERLPVQDVWTEKEANSFWGGVQDETKIRALLKEFHTPEHEEVILVSRFVYNKSLREISEEHGFTSPSTVLYILRESLRALKKKMLYRKGLKDENKG